MHNPLSSSWKPQISALIVAISVWLAFEYVFLGPYSFVMVHDEMDSMIPKLINNAAALKREGVSYWNPSGVCGTDRLSNLSRYPHVPFLLFAILPGWAAYQILMFLFFFVSVYFTHRFCVERLKLSNAAGIFAGLSFAVCVNTITLFIGIALFPMILLWMERIVERGDARSRLAPIVPGLVFSFFGVMPLSLPFALALTIVWFVFVRRRWDSATLLKLLLFCVAAAAMHIPELLALLRNIPSSHRADWNMFEIFDNYYAHVIRTYIVAHFLGGAAAVVLAVCGLCFFKLRDRTFLGICALALACTVGTTAAVILLDVVSGDLPFSKGLRLYRFSEFSPFFIALCGGYGLNAVVNGLKNNTVGIGGKSLKLSSVIVAVAVAALLVKNLHVTSGHMELWLKGNYVAFLQNKDVEKLRDAGEPGSFRVATVGEHADFASAYGLETSDGYYNLYPERYQRFWSKVIERAANQDKHIDEYFNEFGSRAYLFIPKNALFSTMKPSTANLRKMEFGKFFNLNLLSLANTRFILSKYYELEDENLVRRTADRVQWFEEADRKRGILRKVVESNFRGEGVFQIYENKNSLPRFFFTKKVRAFDSLEELMDALGAAELETIKTTLFIERRYEKSVAGHGRGGAPVVIEKYSNDYIRLSLDVEGDAVLVASNSYSPFWRCRVDGKDREILPAYGAFWAVPVDAKTRLVEFSYEPPYSKLANPLGFFEETGAEH